MKIVRLYEFVTCECFGEQEIKSHSALDGAQNADGGLSPPSDNGGNDGGNVEAEQSEEENEQSQNDLYQDMPYHRRDGNLIVDFTAMPDAVPSDSFGGSRRGESSQSRRGKKKQDVTLEDSSSSNLAQSSSDFSLDETSQSSQGNNPVNPAYYPHAYFTIINIQLDKLHLTNHHQ
ncbi:hypothetical protein RIF29_39084 [Crotalaria pallida]|uniref:Uncharacterized protein n=1 Tax=Crotalaria pallida TaxID=3830 RepID=A0AAN9E167_CROPI